MSNFSFKPDQPELTSLLEEIHHGDLQLPDFQRSWVWDDDRIRDLIASVSLGWPVGAILVLECGGQVRFKAREFEGSPANRGRERRLVLDGQQRLTSLYLALRSGKPVRTVSLKQQEIERLYYIDIKLCLDRNVDRKDAILALPPTRQIRTDFDRTVVLDLSTPDLEYEKFCIPVSVAFSGNESRAWRRGLNVFHKHSPEVSELWDKFEEAVVGPLHKYRLPAIELSRDTTREAVCMVFEKVNTGGKPLDVFELVTAAFAIDNFDMREDWDARQKRLAVRPILSELSSAEFLQAVTLVASYTRSLTDKTPVGCRRVDVLKLDLAQYQAHAQAVENALTRVAQLLDRECIYDASYLPYASQLIPMAAIAAHLGVRVLEEPARSKMLRWYWCGVFGELYGGTTETRFSRDMVQVPAWVDGGPEPTTVRDCNFSPNRLWTLRTKLSAAYKGFMAQLLQCGARDLYQGDEVERSRYFDDKIDIHHVFPQEWCLTRQIKKERFDSILNKTPLTGRTNKRLGSKAPSTYLKRIEESGVPELDTILQSHLLDAKALRTDDFDSFLRERARSLLDRVEVVTGKAVQGRDSAEVVLEFGGDLTMRAASAATVSAAKRLFEKYEELAKLPSGGMSEGYKVRSIEDGSIAFLKRVPTHGIAGDALRRELDIYARLGRAQAVHVLDVYAFERGDEDFALVTEFAEGGALADYVTRHGELTAPEAKAIALEVLAGLSELHSLEIIHRDLKPENVFRSKDKWKLGDFGISKSLQRLATQGRTFQGHGTLGFAPPEQLDGAEAHPSADIYAFGKLLAFLTTGQTDVDQMHWPTWAKIARDCTQRAADQRPTLDDVETAVGAIAV
ncbi:MAG: DUF262 domain-containing protein [Deltaproteobacteria bacterium]|nr:DUF262 domain-containing protein [Deltaproteobacteria bacterium]